MRKNLFNWYIIATVILFDFVAFADPGGDDEDGELETEDVVLPINGKLLWLAIAGVLFAFYSFKNWSTDEKA